MNSEERKESVMPLFQPVEEMIKLIEEDIVKKLNE